MDPKGLGQGKKKKSPNRSEKRINNKVCKVIRKTKKRGRGNRTLGIQKEGQRGDGGREATVEQCITKGSTLLETSHIALLGQPKPRKRKKA